MAFDLTPYQYDQTKDYGVGFVDKANKQLQQLQDLLKTGQIGYSDYQQAMNQFVPQAIKEGQGIAGSGSRGASSVNPSLVPLAQSAAIGGSQDLGTFINLYKNLTGKDATSQDITNYFSTVAPELQTMPGGANNVQDVHTLINQYLSDQYQPQIQDYQKQQQTSALQSAQQQAQDLIKQQNQQTVDQLTSPESVEQFKRAYNRGGLLDSGVFSQGVADTLANAASGNISSALGSVTVPSINNIQGTSNAPYQQYLQNLVPNTQSYGSAQQSQENFSQQSQLAQQLQSMMQPSSLQQWAPIISGALQGGGMAASGKTYLCTHMKKLNLMTEAEVEAVHKKIFPYALLHPLDLIAYAILAPAFIRHPRSEFFNWAALKVRLCDEIIECETAREAFQKYKNVCLEIFPLMEFRHG